MSILYDRARANPAGFRDVDPTTVAGFAGKVRLVDVRNADELTGPLGHIAGAELVPLPSIEAAARTWNKDEEVVLVCRSGGRSGRAAAALAAAGFTRLMNMTGGMLAWNEAKLPVER